ncbi:DNA-binding response regulator, OmpR family, contains REC and winged-helix (wHTH) domain [Anaerosporobacter mobilis DSM 15930]|uniref:Stage 0 sporulation protein A homolog n=1 Tax=Anaerosporobacter mobilis DSM 15930 TaxID=1120996 RepID=A0A1M7GUJ6_9FIRM|nr:response regulator transcription factor [Anaerosporobacter mobilis]SHM19519.1 DNA-binding response regulator, OmpR family, contains REC and winged-helix (wHTH) domain [Anaerosporobacter mobilis DSM 15930]
MRILVVEDERDLNSIIVKRLNKAGYSVDTCYDGEEALDYMRMGEYDVILLDIMMPKMNGLDVVRTLRKKRDKTPVLLLTAKDAIEDRVMGLDSGADDYLVKPFAFDELLARVRVLTRRSIDEVTNVFAVANLSVDCDTRIVKRGETVIPLSSKEFSVLEYMIRNQGVVLSRAKIEQHIWNFDYEGGSNVIDVYIRYLRKKIDQDFEPKLIHTIRGAGYVLRDEANHE